MLITFAGCEHALSGNDDLIEKAKEEMRISDAENIEIEYAGLVVKEGKALIWFIAGNEYSDKTYHAMECEVINDKGKQNKFKFIRMSSVIDDRGEDIAICNWQGGYCFLINNENCNELVIKTDKETVYNIKKDGCPYIEYIDPFTTVEYMFYDDCGNEIK